MGCSRELKGQECLTAIFQWSHRVSYRRWDLSPQLPPWHPVQRPNLNKPAFVFYFSSCSQWREKLSLIFSFSRPGTYSVFLRGSVSRILRHGPFLSLVCHPVLSVATDSLTRREPTLQRERGVLLSPLMRAIVRLVNGDPPNATWFIFYFHEKFFDWSEIRDFKYHPGARHVRIEIVIDPSAWSRGTFDFHCEPAESNVDACVVYINSLFSSHDAASLSRFRLRLDLAPSFPANWRAWSPCCFRGWCSALAPRLPINLR